MRIAFFDTHKFERPYFEEANKETRFTFTYYETPLKAHSAPLASGHDIVCCFVNDQIDAEVIRSLAQHNVRMLALRSAGFNNVDLEAAQRFNLPVTRVPEYSPYAVAEHATALALSLNRKIHLAYHRIRDMNFSLDGMVGFDMHSKTVGILGTGKIGSVFAKIMHGFGCKLLGYDLARNLELEKNYGLRYKDAKQVFEESDIISLHLPLNPLTRHIVDEAALESMKPGCMLINTGRGALIDTKALLNSLKSGKLGYAGLDVYEEEEAVFFRDLSGQILKDDCLARLTTFPNVLITSHQGFLTREALANIASTTLQNISDFERGRPLKNQVFWENHVK